MHGESAVMTNLDTRGLYFVGRVPRRSARDTGLAQISACLIGQHSYNQQNDWICVFVHSLLEIRELKQREAFWSRHD